MKKLVLAVAMLLMTPTSLHAQEDLCPQIGSLAESVMKARQLGIPKYRVLELATPGPAYRLYLSMVDLAYRTPVYPTKSMQQSAIDAFKNQSEYLCYQNN